MQTIRIISVALFLLATHYSIGQEQSKIDYSIESIILNPDTLKGDQKLVFNHFLKWSYKQVREAAPDKIKNGFKKIGISIKDKDRFREAYYFFKLEMTAHKKNVEDWEEFKILDPRNKKSKNHKK